VTAPLAEAARAAAVPPFHAMAMARAASELEAAGRTILHLEVGQPSTPAPQGAREAAIAAIGRGEPLGYTNAAGSLALRRRIARHYGDWYGTHVEPDEVLVVGGASAGFTLAFAACFDVGDRVGVLEPGYPCYRNALTALGARPVGIPLEGGTGGVPSAAQLESAMPLSGLVVASPSNPTGAVLRDAALAEIVAWCAANGVRLISDEIYHGLVTTGRAGSARSHTDQAVVVNSFSKYFSMTGWRLGWMLVPGPLRAAVERLQQNLYICAPHVSQVAGLAALDCQVELDGHVARYRANRTALLDGLAEAGLAAEAADGAFYAYVDVAHLTSDSMQLCRAWLHDLGVAATPGTDFDPVRGHRYVRFSYAGAHDDLVEACSRIASRSA